MSRRRCLRALTALLLPTAPAATAPTVTLMALTAARPAPAAVTRLPAPASLSGLLDGARQTRAPVVALFSRAGCPWCEALRREQLLHLARDADAQGVRVVEFDIADRRRFVPPDQTARAPVPQLAMAESPAALAALLKIRLAPTVVFLGPAGELAERLVGYPSPDFYGAYLAQRVEEARRALRAAH